MCIEKQPSGAVFNIKIIFIWPQNYQRTSQKLEQNSSMLLGLLASKQLFLLPLLFLSLWEFLLSLVSLITSFSQELQK